MSEGTVREMVIGDYEEVADLWKRTEGVGLNESDTEDAISVYLNRNPGMSAVAVNSEGKIIGDVLCGHDGRRGYLHHLAVTQEHRRQGIGTRLLDHCFGKLGEEGIPKCSIFIYSDNEEGKAFWLHNGWKQPGWEVFQKEVG